MHLGKKERLHVCMRVCVRVCARVPVRVCNCASLFWAEQKPRSLGRSLAAILCGRHVYCGMHGSHTSQLKHVSRTIVRSNCDVIVRAVIPFGYVSSGEQRKGMCKTSGRSAQRYIQGKVSHLAQLPFIFSRSSRLRA